MVDSMCSRNFGYSPNWVKWLYAVVTGRCTSTISMMWPLQARYVAPCDSTATHTGTQSVDGS